MTTDKKRDIDLQTYRQVKGPYKLQHSIYKFCLNKMLCYNTFKGIREGILNKSAIKLDPCKASTDMIAAEKEMKLIEEAILKLPKEYQPMIFEYICLSEMSLTAQEIADKYYVSEDTVKMYRQRAVFFYAIETGVNFKVD